MKTVFKLFGILMACYAIVIGCAIVEIIHDTKEYTSVNTDM